MQTVAMDLQPGEVVFFSQTNCMCWMNDAIEMNTTAGGGVPSGFMRSLGGGEGLFLATLTGPGHVALQSMPILNLRRRSGGFCRGRRGVRTVRGRRSGRLPWVGFWGVCSAGPATATREPWPPLWGPGRVPPSQPGRWGGRWGERWAKSPPYA